MAAVHPQASAQAQHAAGLACTGRLLRRSRQMRLGAVPSSLPASGALGGVAMAPYVLPWGTEAETYRIQLEGGAIVSFMSK